MLHTKSLSWTRRYTRLVLIALVTLTTLICYYFLDLRGSSWRFTLAELSQSSNISLLPPLYSWHHQQELQLPQHNPDLLVPEGRNGKYIWTPNHVHGSGWGNVMQEHILNSHLAYASGRALVFDNFTWNTNGSDYTESYGRLVPSRIPLTAFIAGPAAGGAFPEGNAAPRFVTKEYFDIVCPSPIILKVEDVIRHLHKEASAEALFEAWLAKLGSEDRCIEIDQNSDPMFHIWLFMLSSRLLDIWPSLSVSPILTNFAWSPLIHAAFLVNSRTISPSRMPSWISPILPSTDLSLPKLIALHLRRGDFEGHCTLLSEWEVPFMGFNEFPELPNKFSCPRGKNVSAEDKWAMYQPRCFPSIAQIVARVKEVRRTPEGMDLRNIYIMTNGDQQWVLELIDSLRSMGGWDRITTGRDLTLNREQQYVAQALDMMIGQHAQMFIGNGFSSLTSNVIMLRMANGVNPASNRFW